ncbi:zinc dependent phospholipase C family protein [Saprospiraceae bacterium]|nr:zinc dependent phospholipase C family protein [Saprospiraceae bacterium]
MKIARYTIFVTIVVLAMVLSSAHTEKVVWGFYGHKKINRMAVFALPQEMIGFYKKNIEYITEHAVDADKRRYATKYEAVRHYIDIDHWGKIPFLEVPRQLDDALMKYGQLQLIDLTTLDTTNLSLNTVVNEEDRFDPSIAIMNGDQVWHSIKTVAFENFFKAHFKTQYYEDEWIVEGQVYDEIFETDKFASGNKVLRFVDQFSHQGILPYHLESMFFQLRKAFIDENPEKVLRLSADYGHYIADSHVPLHTTVNYNGQLTDQVGIHAFWESRLPELFAEEKYDFFVGSADYIEQPRKYFWNIITESHELLDSVLSIEKRLSQSFPPDRQYCYDERLSRTVRIECEEYATAYHEAMGDMVEMRMQGSIRAISSVWYSAWVSAGQPDINSWADEDYKPIEEIKRNSNLGTGSHDERGSN